MQMQCDTYASLLPCMQGMQPTICARHVPCIPSLASTTSAAASGCGDCPSIADLSAGVSMSDMGPALAGAVRWLVSRGCEALNTQLLLDEELPCWLRSLPCRTAQVPT